MMTPVEEMEQIIKEIAVHNEVDTKYSYVIKSFPEIYLIKYTNHYMVEILKDYRQNVDIIKRYEEFRNELGIGKITIENEILDRNRNFLFYGNDLMTYVPICYKDCIFTDPRTLIRIDYKNCIVAKG